MPAKESSPVSKIFSEKCVVDGIVIGILLIWIAMLTMQFGSTGDILKAAKILRYTGLALVSIMLIGGGITSKDDKSVRIAMIVMGVAVLLMQLYWWTYYYPYYY